MVAPVKTLLDELFGARNFRAWITRRKCSSKNYTRTTFGDIADYVLFYSKSADYVFNRQFEQRTPEQEAIDFPKVDPRTGRRFALVPVHARGRRNGATGSRWRGMLPPAGKHWQWTPEKLDECEANGDIHWTRNGTPRRRIWADESPGSSVTNLWLHFRDPFNQNFATTGYPTEKNADLLGRIVASASNPEDLVLDAYAGSGTTLAAASALGRRWIGIDRGELAVALAQRRLAEQVLGGADPRAGFEVWAPEPRPHATAEIEFAFVERTRGDGVPRVFEVLAAAEMAERASTLALGERLVGFDHSGREAVYEEPAERRAGVRR
jgi:adenine-specific DNA-methyltransferase